MKKDNLLFLHQYSETTVIVDTAIHKAGLTYIGVDDRLGVLMEIAMPYKLVSANRWVNLLFQQ
jgi:hypothetical protein